jgi:hypothetical protein
VRDLSSIQHDLSILLHITVFMNCSYVLLYQSKIQHNRHLSWPPTDHLADTSFVLLPSPNFSWPMRCSLCHHVANCISKPLKLHNSSQ